MARPSTTPPAVERRIVELYRDGATVAESVATLRSEGAKLTDGSDVTRHTVYRVRKRADDEPEEARRTPPERGDGGMGAREVSHIISNSPAGNRAPLPKRGTSTQEERGEIYGWLKRIVGNEVRTVLQRSEDGVRVVRCDKCGLTDTRRIDHLTRSSSRLARLLRDAEQSEVDGVRVNLQQTAITVKMGAPEPGGVDVPEADPTPLLSVAVVAGIRSYLEEHGLSWDDLMTYLRAYPTASGHETHGGGPVG